VSISVLLVKAADTLVMNHSKQITFHLTDLQSKNVGCSIDA
jgi:hypothetical protein